MMGSGTFGAGERLQASAALLDAPVSIGAALRDATALDCTPAHLARTAMARHIAEHLTSRHPDLGRPGPICPFLPRALARELVYIAGAAHSRPAQADLLDLMTAVGAEFSSWRRTLAPDDRQHAALVIVFPNLGGEGASRLVRQVQQAAKLFYLQQGLMIGEFYPGCSTPGFHNAGFHPLDTPVASLAVRSLTVFDAPFMLERDEYIQTYLGWFGQEGQRRLAALQASASTTRCPRHGLASAGAVERAPAVAAA